MSIRKERYWLRNRELVHGAKMYVMPQLGVRISWRERCKPGPRHTRSRHRFIPKEIYVAVSKICRFPSLCDRLERERAEVFSEGSPSLVNTLWMRN